VTWDSANRAGSYRVRRQVTGVDPEPVQVALAKDLGLTIDGLPPGNVISWAESPGFATTYYPDADRPGASVPALGEGTDLTGVDLSLPVESSLTVQLVGEGDVGDVSVMLYNSTYTVARGSPVDDDGRVTIGGLFPGEYTLYVYGADAGFEEGLVLDDAGEPVVYEVDGATSVDVALAPAASISGRVLDDAGKPVYGAYVSAVPTNGDSAQSAQSDANGVYSLTGLVAGTYTLTSQYVAYCPNDPGYVQVWWRDALQPETAASFVVDAGAPYPDTDIVLPVDGDHDHMGDAWETDNGLDPARDDSAEDADGDGFTNIEEYLLGTDPTASAGKDAGCGGCGGSSASALLLVVGWGVRRRRRATPSA
jgi:hypothetical protein